MNGLYRTTGAARAFPSFGYAMVTNIWGSNNLNMGTLDKIIPVSLPYTLPTLRLGTYLCGTADGHTTRVDDTTDTSQWCWAYHRPLSVITVSRRHGGQSCATLATSSSFLQPHQPQITRFDRHSRDRSGQDAFLFPVSIAYTEWVTMIGKSTCRDRVQYIQCYNS